MVGEDKIDHLILGVDPIGNVSVALDWARWVVLFVGMLLDLECFSLERCSDLELPRKDEYSELEEWKFPEIFDYVAVYVCIFAWVCRSEFTEKKGATENDTTQAWKREQKIYTAN